MKTSIDRNNLVRLLTSLGFTHYGVTIKRMSEGQESEAFQVTSEGRQFALRINSRIDGFLKDKLAHDRFSSSWLPIPRVVQLGRHDDRHAYCLSELVPGYTLQDAHHTTLSQLAPMVDDIHQRISDSAVLGMGFGPFDADGRAPFASWREYLESDLPLFSALCAETGSSLIQLAIDTYSHLVQFCPEERRLVHGDFGANNVLTDGTHITGVIDWEDALYGDPLFDVAIAFVWSFHLVCMDVQRNYWQCVLSGSESFQERILCYQVKIMLNEIDSARKASNEALANVMLDRLRVILSGCGYV